MCGYLLQCGYRIYGPAGRPVNEAYYVEIPKWLCEAVCRRPGLWTINWIHRHDNAPAHKVLC